jgi:hypothetical protein
LAVTCQWREASIALQERRISRIAACSSRRQIDGVVGQWVEKVVERARIIKDQRVQVFRRNDGVKGCHLEEWQIVVRLVLKVAILVSVFKTLS